MTRIGGPNTVVQVEERGHKDWLGGIKNITKLSFVDITDDHSAGNLDDLDDIIPRHEIPGSVVCTDMWRGYSNLTKFGYIWSI
ncbi:hypothetical protein ANCDUO_12195 [Ancylostoma duodenale]|uniref:ISXO2-like transposase domain-containing protein n=1 Tax=Ancylostoma duodenale TaxID=51022 RepID=A0A0C2GFD2_9BILA|nr:hypothetical protein ANCDUO_12195 [Ancylostoma duodenale]